MTFLSIRKDGWSFLGYLKVFLPPLDLETNDRGAPVTKQNVVTYPFEQVVEEPIAPRGRGIISIEALHDSFVPLGAGILPCLAGNSHSIGITLRFTDAFLNLVSFLREEHLDAVLGVPMTCLHAILAGGITCSRDGFEVLESLR